MIDIVIPNNNEKEFIEIAEKLGYNALCFLYNFDDYLDKQKNFGRSNKKIKIYIGILADSKNINKINNKLKNKTAFIAIKSSINNREITEKSKSNLIFSFEDNFKKDFIHQRASGLDHILCKLAHENNIMIGFSLSSILSSENKHIILGRITQNIKLCRKYKVKTVIASFAQNPFEMRGPHDVISLFVSLGMHQKEAKESLRCILSNFYQK